MVLAALGPVACQGGPSEREATATSQQTVVADAIALPPIPQAERLKPLEGEALARARKPLDEILADLSTPDYLVAASETHDAPDASDDRETDEPPLAAQHAYVAGRAAWRAGNTYEAISELEEALRLAPDRPDLLRLLGQIYMEAGNKVRAAMNIRKAVRADPGHIPSVFLLGRFALEQGDHDEAIVILHHALEQVRRQDADEAETDRALEPLLHYYLAGALREQEYAAAAIAQHEQYLAITRGGRGFSRTSRELAVIDQQALFTWTAMGDMHHQLRAPEAALAAYRQAAADANDNADENADARGEAPSVPVELVARLVYTHLQLDQLDPAQQLVIDHVRRTEADETALALVRYLSEQVDADNTLANQLREVYRTQDRPGGLAMALAELLPEDQASALLREHLAAHPNDLHVLEGLLRRLLTDSDEANQPEQVAEAIAVTAEAMRGAPEQVEQRARALLEAVGDATALLDGFEAMEASQRDAPMVQLLHGLTWRRAGSPDRAREALQGALAAAPKLDAARLALAELAMAEGEHERARALLEPMKDHDAPRVLRLRVQVLAETGELDAALALLDQRMDRDQPNVGLVLQKAELQIRADEAATAERTLLDALNMYPYEERLYAAILNMYDPGNNRAPLVDDATRQWQRLVRRLLETIPDSRLGRLVRAELYGARGQVDEALRLLASLLETRPMDLEVIQRMVRLHESANQHEQAAALLDEKIEAQPRNLDLLTIALQFYHRTEDEQRGQAVLDRMLKLDPPAVDQLERIVALAVQLGAPEKATAAVERALAAGDDTDGAGEAGAMREPMRLVSLLRLAMHRAGEGEKAVGRLRELAARFPEHEAEIRNHLSMLLQQLGRDDEAEQVLVETLERHPDHAPTNNALGYEWARQGRNLARAKAMIEKALETEPNSAAYLDSLGWVYYKQGKFDEAVTWLERARAAEGGEDPVIVDHLGDALYRAGRVDEARRAWGRAAALHGRMSFPEEYPELSGLRERAQQKIQAVRDQAQPAVAEVGEVATERAE